MQLAKISKLFALTLAAASLAACSSKSTNTESGAEISEDQGYQVTTPTDSDLNNSSADQDASNGSALSQWEQDLLSQTKFYFDFDQALIKTEDRRALAAHAKYLIENTNLTVVLEGHADERGTREYNLALGQRRAGSVASFLEQQGVSSGQIVTNSYGEERPEVIGQDDVSHAKNRRVELRYE